LKCFQIDCFGISKREKENKAHMNCVEMREQEGKEHRQRGIRKRITRR
jgi:hypothetical protein